MSHKPYCIESFAGAGGMALGLIKAGFDVKLAFDIDAPSVETYNKNIANHSIVEDASSVSGKFLLERANISEGDLALFSGGPPCQGFSKQRRGAALLSDPRNQLVLDYARLVTEMRPQSFLFENVQIFGQKRGKNLIKEIREMLSEYYIYTYFLCSSSFGLAQSRGRFIMIGLRKDVSGTPPLLPTVQEKKTVRDVIYDIPPPPEDCTEHPDIPNHMKCRISKANEERISHVPQGGGWKDIPWELRLPCHQKVDDTKGGWPDVYGRLEWDGVCPTITGGFDSFSRGRYGHPVQNRAITPHEAALLQGFPEKFRFIGNRSDVRKQIGNAVPPPLAEAAGKAILRTLNNSKELPKEFIKPREGNKKQLSLAV